MYPDCIDLDAWVIFFFRRNMPCPPIDSFHPRSKVRVVIIRAVFDIMFFVVVCEILLKNQVFVKNVVLIFVFIVRIIVEAIIAPNIVIVNGVFFIIGRGNRGGIFISHFESSQP